MDTFASKFRKSQRSIGRTLAREARVWGVYLQVRVRAARRAIDALGERVRERLGRTPATAVPEKRPAREPRRRRTTQVA